MNTVAFQTSIFDTIGGLPVHPLAVHVAVVFLPLSALALAILIFVPKWRKSYFPLTLIGLSISTIFTFIAKESGEQLGDRVGEPKTHGELGEILFPAAVGLLAVAVAFYFLQKSNKPKWMLQVAAGVALAAILSVSTLTYFVGHTGAEATWSKRVAEPTASPTPSNTETPGTGLTAAEVAKHDKASDCWIIIEGNVYDLTSYIQQHPGGSGVLTNLCGKDATQAFTSQHASEMAPASALAALKIGKIGATPKPTPTPTKTTPAPKPTAGTYTKAEVAKHSTGTDCWSIVNGKVYNLTTYVSSHPGGSAVIKAICGKDGTAAFTGQHSGQSTPTSVLAGFKIGTLSTSGTEKPPVVTTYTAPQITQHSTRSSCWSVVNKNVYDLTSYVSNHPGGASAIAAICGKDGTAAFSGQHGGQSTPTSVLTSFKIGVFSASGGALPVGQGEEEEEGED